MLNKLRNSSKNSFIKIVLGSLLTILILSFAMWGTEDLIGVTNKQNTVASVGKIDVSAKEFYGLYTRQTEEIRKLLGASLDIEKGRQFGYVDRALSSLINRALFNNEANELGLSVSDTNVRDKILNDPAFKDDLGQFSELIFRQLISEAGYSEDTYISGTRQDLAREQMVETIRSSLKIPNVIKESLGKYNMEERTVDYLVLDLSSQKLPKVNDTELKNSYEDNKNMYMTNEYRKVKTLLLDAKKYAENIIITDDEIKLLYEERKESLVKPERRYLKQILTESKEKAAILYKKINSDNFTNIALNQEKLDESDIDLGWNTKDELPEEIVEQVFSLGLKEVSKPIESSFGWHIIKVFEIEERKELTFEDVKNSIKNELLLEKGKDSVYDLQDDIEDFLASGDSLEEISEKLDVKLIQAEAIDKNGKNNKGEKNLEFQDERILRTIFAQEENEEGNIIDIDKDEGLAINLVEKIIPSRIMNFNEAKNLVKKNVIREKQFNGVQRTAKIIKKEIENSGQIEKIAKKYKLEVRGVAPFNRINPDDSELPLPLISDIFKEKLKGVTLFERNKEEIIIAQVASITNSYGKNKEDLKSFTSKIEDDMSIDLLAQFSEILRKKYKISINDDVINQLN